ncbi:reverse transcriptase domain-containing protein [Tanacetum coccineum]
MLKFLQIFQRLHFDRSFVDALLHIPKFAFTFKSLLSNKEKLFELANTPLNENYECLALADLGVSINLMSLSVWKKLSLPELTPTRMTLDLANRSVAYPVGVAEDVFVKVGKTTRALIDVHGEELILRDEDEQLIFHVDNTSKHPHESINMINFIDITCKDRFSEVLKFKKSNHPSSGSTTPFSDSLLEEFADELTLLDPFPPGNEDDNFDREADLRKIKYLLNQEPSTESSPKSDIEIIDPIRFTNEPAHVYSPPPGDDDSDKECDFPFCDNFEENFKMYSNPLFEFDDEYISSDVNPLFNEELEDIESKDSYVSDEPILPVTPLFDANEDECFNPGGDIDEINAFLDMDVSTIAPDYEDSHARGFVHRSIDLLSLACLYMGIRYPISY